jgi:hypothetical protein
MEVTQISPPITSKCSYVLVIKNVRLICEIILCDKKLREAQSHIGAGVEPWT